MREIDPLAQERIHVPKKADKGHQELTESDVYTELQMRGLQHSESFRSIRKSSANGTNATLIWKNEWITFLEGMIQIKVLSNDVRRTQVPIKIRKVIIDVQQHEEATKNLNGTKIILVNLLNLLKGM